GKKKTLTSTPLPLNGKKKEEKKSTCTLSPGAPFPPSHNEFVKKITPSLPTVKKSFPKTLNVPLSPSSFHLFIYLGQKKTLTSTPLPLNSQKKEGKKSTCTLS
ncbi:unnamed protein product, partial [Sphagnum compactum]